MQSLIVSIQEGAAALEGFLTIAVDKAVEAAVKLAAAGCLADVPGINVVAAIVGAEEVHEVVTAIRNFVDEWTLFCSKREGVVGVIAGLSAGLVSYNLSGKLPETNYVNQSQTTIDPYRGTSHDGF